MMVLKNHFKLRWIIIKMAMTLKKGFRDAIIKQQLKLLF